MVRRGDASLWKDNYALGLALAVLALEEIGKFCLIDATLFSFHNDEVVRRVRRFHTDHRRKLAYLDIWPLILRLMAEHSPRYSEAAFKLQFDATIRRYRDIRQGLQSWIPNCDLTALDSWKQRGFYVALQGGRFQAPTEAVSRDKAEAIVSLADVMVNGTVTFGLYDIDGYLAWAGRQRRTLTPEGIDKIRGDLSRAFGPDANV